MNGPGCVYVIQAGTDGPVKIGHTIGDPYRRMAQLQTGHHKPLRLVTVFPGGPDLERFFHGVLWTDRLRGEWFLYSANVRAFLVLQVLDWADDIIVEDEDYS